MRKSLFLLYVLLTLSLVALAGEVPLASAANANDATEAREKHILNGIFRCGFQDGPGRVRATFVATDEEDAWKVTFNFTFAERRHTYAGVSKGNFTSGELAGVVKDETGGRTFTFYLEKKNGKYKGTHAEIIRGREQPTGTIELKE